MADRRLVRARYGTMNRPARTVGSVLHGSLVGPVPWSDDIGAPPPTVFWMGNALEDGQSPIGPHGPYPSYGASLPVVTRALSLIADPLTAGRLRTRVYTPDQPTGTLSTDWVRWLTDPQLLRPDARIGPSMIPAPQRLTRSTFWRTFVAVSIGWGRSFMYFLETPDQQPIAGTMRLVHPGLVEVDEDGRWKIGDYVFDDDGRRNGGRIVCLHSPLHEEGVFLAHPETFSLGRKIEKYTSSTFRSGVPSGFLKVSTPNYTEAQARNLQQQWMDAHGGDSRSVAVLNATTEWQGVSFSPVDAALAEVKRLNIADVAFAFNISPEVLGVTMGNSATYSNVGQWWEAHRDFSLSTWISAFEGVLSSLMPSGTEVEVNLDQFENPDFSARMASYEVAIRAGVLTRNEARAREGLDPLPPEIPNSPYVQDIPAGPLQEALADAPEPPVEPQDDEEGSPDASA